MTIRNSFRGLSVSRNEDGTIARTIVEFPLGDLPAGHVRVAIRYSALNFKDALALQANPGVARKLPLVPGIDAVGIVTDSRSPLVPEGTSVIIQHAEFGTAQDGGYREIVEVPAEWALPIPEPLSLLDTITLGTAGFTAAQCCEAIEQGGIALDDGDVVVSGATGGVGVFAVMLLNRIGYRVVASTGKVDRTAWLKSLGAAEVIPREAVNDASPRPLLSARWSAAVDTVGGNTLATIIRATKPHRVVTACGLVGGNELALTVYPFILRGISLIGIDSANIERDDRIRLWRKLAGAWKLDEVSSLAEIHSITDVEPCLERILVGRVAGRVVFDLTRLP